MRRLVLIVLALTGCGDNLLGTGVALAPSHDLVVVAHQDDDLLFMQPDLIEAVQRGQGVTNVYVTAGNGTKGTDAADIRYAGLMQAYGAAAGSTDWSCGWIELLGHAAQHCRLATGTISLVFLAYPDGGKEGEQPSSLLHLWEGAIGGADTIALRSAHYDQVGLIDVVAEIVRDVQPAVVRTLDIASTHGRDHSDHMIVGALSLLAITRARAHVELISYRGYDIADEPANKIQPVFDETRAILAHYEACATGCGTCGEACTAIDTTHDTWLERRYAIGFRRGATGTLRAETGQCLAMSGALGECATAPVWTLDGDGELRATDSCLATDAGGALASGPCIGGAARRFLLDDEGHVWSSMVPAPAGDMDYAHLGCVTPDGGAARVALCGKDRAPTWEMIPPTTNTTRLSLGVGFVSGATGRQVRLGDLTNDGKADLCSVSVAGLRCAPGDGAGGFGAAIRIDSAAEPLAIDPTSLVIGDIDGDGKLDACGRDSSGILCTSSVNLFAVSRFTPTFADAEARGETSASLAATDADGDGTAEICGLAMEGVICAKRGLSFAPLVRSAWPAPTAVVWPADLDGDGRADWCASSDTGPACGVDAEAALTQDGASWGFALAGNIEDVPHDPAVTALADIDGDGRADLCALDGSRVRCARSQGRGFGPRFTLAEFANTSPVALWLGDLDGDGRADACVDTGATIACALSH